jgi:dnd system-associated protein 4
MKPGTTIADAAELALQTLGRSADIDEIFQHILSNNLYLFNTPTPKHVLYTTLKRNLEYSSRVDASGTRRFRIDLNGKYSLAPSMEPERQTVKSKAPRRVMRASDKEAFIQEILSENVGVFKEVWRILLFAAQVGIKNGRRDPLLNTDSGKGIDQSTFGNAASWPGILYLMNLSEEGASDILGCGSDADDARVILFQEYANGGLAVLQDFFRDRTINLDGFLAFSQMNQEGAPSEVGEADLDLTI